MLLSLIFRLHAAAAFQPHTPRQIRQREHEERMALPARYAVTAQAHRLIAGVSFAFSHATPFFAIISLISFHTPPPFSPFDFLRFFAD
jgi:hypothetical protein